MSNQKKLTTLDKIVLESLAKLAIVNKVSLDEILTYNPNFCGSSRKYFTKKYKELNNESK